MSEDEKDTPSFEGEEQVASTTGQIFRSSRQLFLRQVLVQIASAGSTAVWARALDVSSFGSLSAGLATFYLLGAVCDFGFGLTLAKELGVTRADDGGLVRSMLQAQTAWSLGVGLIGVGVVAAIGFSVPRAQVTLLMLPALAISGLGGIRQVFYAQYRSAALGLIDVSVNVASSVFTSAVAVVTRSTQWTAAAFGLVLVVNGLLVFRAGRRLLDAGRPTSVLRRRLVRQALPFGVASLLASAYFTIDIVIVGFLVSARDVGYYAGATKFLSVLVTIPGLVSTAALAGVARHAADRKALSDLITRLWSWLATVALPLCLGLIVFASVAVHAFLGAKYGPSDRLAQILAASAIVALMSNVVGTAMVATGRSRWLMMGGLLGLVFNVTGNLLLVPHFGVIASAWLTVATEILVCAFSAVGLRRSVDYRPLLTSSGPLLAASGALVGVGWALRHVPAAGIPLAAASFATVLVALRAWPDGLPGPADALVLLRRRRDPTSMSSDRPSSPGGPSATGR